LPGAALPATLPADVAALVDELLRGMRVALGPDLLGVYLRGSLALGGFDPETSDVDILVVTERPIDDDAFAALAALHRELPARDNRYHRYYEVAYVDRAALRRFGPEERVHPTVGSDWPFHRSPLRDNFILELWTVREHGIVVSGPDPKSLIDPIEPDALRGAAARELRSRLDDWAAGEPWPEWLGPRYYQAFEVETICRALFVQRLGRQPTKPEAVAWALGELDEPWHSLVQWSQAHRADKTRDSMHVPEVANFVRWAVERAEKP
jgi:predicted nucleotidyltransferase